MPSIFEDEIPGMKPGDERNVTQDGHVFRIVATRELGCDTGRRRYRVECLTCEALVHEATTSPSCQIESHFRDERDGIRRVPIAWTTRFSE